MGDQPPRRVSKRDKRPITFFGDPVTHTTRKRKQETSQQEETLVEMEENQSMKTAASNQSTVRKIEIELKTKQQIAELEQSYNNKSKELQLMEHKAFVLKEKLRLAEEEVDNAKNEEERDACIEVKNKVAQELNQIGIKIGESKIHLDFQKQEIKSKIDLLQTEAALAKSKVDLEEEKRSITGLSEVDKHEATKSWAENTRNERRDADESDQSEAESVNSSELRQQLKNLRTTDDDTLAAKYKKQEIECEATKKLAEIQKAKDQAKLQLAKNENKCKEMSAVVCEVEEQAKKEGISAEAKTKIETELITMTNELYAFERKLQIQDKELEAQLNELDSQKQIVIQEKELAKINVDKQMRTSQSKVKKKESEKKVDLPSEANAFDNVAEAFVRAMQSASSSTKGNATDRVLARQIQGKDLPTFTGKPSEWPAFIIAYESSTKNCQFTDAENLLRLQRCLKGEAYKTVQCLLVSADSVPIALEILKKCFGRPGMIINSMIAKVKDAPSVQQNKPETWVEFGIAVNNLVATIKALNVMDQLANPSLVYELVQKLPPVSQLDWTKHISLLKVDFPKLEDFANWLKPTTEAAFILRVEKPQEEPKPHNSRRFTRNDRTMLTNEKQNSDFSKNSNQPFTKMKCIACESSDHRIRDCPKFKGLSVNDRWEVVKKEKACSSCINRNHFVKECRSKRKCGINGCDKTHNRLLHSEKPTGKQEKEKEKTREVVKVTQDADSPITKETCLKMHGSKKMHFFVVPVLARTSDNSLVPLHIAFDNMSSLTATDEATAKLLGLKGVKESFTVDGFQETTTVTNSYLIDIQIESTVSDFKHTLKEVKTVPRLSLPTQSLQMEDIRRYPHLQGLDIELHDEVTPTILVGLDNYDLQLPLEIRRGRFGEPAAIRTVFGWTVVGTIPNSKGALHHAFKITEHIEDPLHTYVKHFFTTEAVGVEPNVDRPRSKDDVKAQIIMDRTIKRVEGNRWESGLLWKEENVNLPDSKGYAYKRLMSMERKMDRDPDFAAQYTERIAEYVEKEFARVLSPEEAAITTSKTFYLPHFMAFNEKKPKKLRHVFDAAAKVHGQSLNDHLLQGPDKMVSLVGILLQFRQKAVAVSADIKDFFPRVKIIKEDAAAQRFLWRGMDRNRAPDVLEMGVLIFGAACSPTCAQEAKEKNALEFQDEFPKACEAIINQFYVDDFLTSCDNVEEAIKLQTEVTEVLRRGSFHLCNFLSSSSKVMSSIPEDLRAKSMKSISTNEDLVERVLGMFWRPESDDFTFQMKYLKAKEEILAGDKTPTKRQVLSLVMSIFDPLGLLTILTVKAKMILQATWRAKIGWDDEIPSSTFDVWKQWLDELSRIQTFQLPRCYSLSFSTAEDIQLHIFCDASQEAFGPVAYFRIAKEKIETSIVMAKSNVAPLKPLSIPRLELQAAVMGARLAVFIRKNIKVHVNRTVFWTDSSTVLSWIRADGRKFQQFVGTRIGIIQSLSDVIQWRWIPTNENVADEITRFAKPCDWSPKSRWINGPSFLMKEEKFWPKEKSTEIDPEDPVFEMKKEQVFKIQEVQPVIDATRFSSWSKLLRTIAYVQRFIALKILKQKPEQLKITVKELRDSKETLLKIMQADCFPKEIEIISRNEIVQKPSPLQKLSPALENGYLVVKGRLENAIILSVKTKHPIIISPKHPVVRCLMDYYHKICGHHGQERIANEIRQQYQVLGLRNAIKGAQNRCQECKNKRTMPLPPEMGQLPKFRLERQVRPFIKTGLDYFGPIEVIVKRSREKRYVALFTCLSTRAIHLEIAGSLSSDSCIMALQRFIARRGCPVSIYSDNGTNFVGADAELKKALEELDQSKIDSVCSSKGIEWNFNPPSAPHMGGSWERLVKSVKIALGDTLQQKNLHEEVLLTLLIEAEHTVNSHPLTHVPDDPNDQEALTPNHFLIGQSSNLQPMGEFGHFDLCGRRQWRITKTLADYFWKRWVKEYLPTLLRRAKWIVPVKSIAVGDVVVEINNNLPRGSWPKGRVVALYPGRDGIVRVVDVIHANRHIYRRPVAKLCILDVQDEDIRKSATPDGFV